MKERKGLAGTHEGYKGARWVLGTDRSRPGYGKLLSELIDVGLSD